MKTLKSERTNDELLMFLANATKTYYGCGGHGKAASNKALAGAYKEELTERGIEIPTDDELLKTGKFNGEGSY